MREIEFRGKRIDNSEWIYGWLRQTGHQNIEKSNGQYIRTEKYYQIQDEKYNSQFVDETTIGQYTGLKDKNKKKMYEGDIIEIKVYDSFAKQCISTKKCVIEFKNGIFGVMFTKAQELTAFVHFTNTTFEVIGNIYENKELLSEVENWK